MKKLLTILLLVFTLVSCADDLVAPKYEDEENPDKPTGGEEPR
jgi:PBP1b-binding outer membrane lipoprotein LpoB